jgi:xanthine dehydrogenase FAD-binding subunit
MFDYHRPRSIEETLSLLQRAAGTALPFAGGTDLLPRWSRGLAQRPDSVVDLKAVEGLTGISRANGEVRLGACTPLSEIASDPFVGSSAPVLAQAAGRIACPQIRNRATVGGNLCNASPAADTAIPLILLDATLEVASTNRDGIAVREVPIADFFRGPGSTVLCPGEILTHIRFRPLPEGVFTAWDKFGTRPAMEIAVASVGLALRVKGGVIADARVGYGSVAPVPMRGSKAEAVLTGEPLSAELIAKCEAAAREEISPITDVRAAEAYRREVVGVMLRRMLERAGRAFQS